MLTGGSGFGPTGDLYAPDPAAAADLLTVRWPDTPRETAPLDHLADEEYSRIVRQRTELLRRLYAGLRERYPRLCEPGAEHAEAVEDLGRLPDFLAAANYVDDPRVLTDYLSFGAAFLDARGVPTDALGVALGTLSGPLGDLPRVSAHLAAGRRWLAAEGHTVPPA